MSSVLATESQNVTSSPMSVFFYCCEKGYEHLSICLAEGLKELGIPFYSNVNYWQISSDREEYLFCHNTSVSPQDCSVVILSSQWFMHKNPIPENLFRVGRKYITIYLDSIDGPKLYCGLLELEFDFVLRTHYDSNTSYPPNFRPWSFELSNRVLQETKILPNYSERRRRLLVNFRIYQERLRLRNWVLKAEAGLLTIEQGFIMADKPLRKFVRDHFWSIIQKILPVDETVDEPDRPPADSYHHLHWTQTGSRHHPNYYKRLKDSAACACFGGWVVPSATTGKSSVQWWDSWRFWESLAAGCVTFHVDFEKYGMIVPVMPQNWEHYIGINLDNLEECVERIASDPEILERISTSGRQWVIENYGPIPTAIRFLETIGANLSTANPIISKTQQLTLPLPIQLNEINLIIFPNWQQPEDSLSSDLERVIRVVATHPDKSQMALLIDTSNFAEEDADLILSSVAMNLLMKEDLNVTDGPEITLIGQLDESHWEELVPQLYARLILENENKQVLAQMRAKALPSSDLNSFNNKRAVRSNTGNWQFS